MHLLSDLVAVGGWALLVRVVWIEATGQRRDEGQQHMDRLARENRRAARG